MRSLRAKLRKGLISASVFAIAATVLALSMITPVVSSTADFSIFNTGWNGVSSMAVSTYRTGVFVPSFEVRSTGTDLEVVTTGLLDMDLDPGTTALAIIGPTKPFTDQEAAKAGAFVRAGGMLLLADDFGTGNSLLEKMGAGSRLSGFLVMDLAFDKRPEFPVCFDIEDDDLTDNVTTILLNYPSSITPGENAVVLARTSIASWLDRDGDRVQDWDEPRGPFPVLAREEMGGGTIILLSDPSVLINGMRDQADDGALADNIVSGMCLGRTAVLFDEGHRDFFSPVDITASFVGGVSTDIKLVLVVVAFVLILWTSTDLVEVGLRRAATLVLRPFRTFLARARGRTGAGLPTARGKGAPELVHELSARHPEWSAGTVKYLVKEGERHRKALEHT